MKRAAGTVVLFFTILIGNGFSRESTKSDKEYRKGKELNKRQYLGDPLSGYLERRPRINNHQSDHASPSNVAAQFISNTLSKRLPPIRDNDVQFTSNHGNAQGSSTSQDSAFSALLPIDESKVGTSSQQQKNLADYKAMNPDLTSRYRDKAKEGSNNGITIGSFKIDDKAVKGFGMYEIKKDDEVEMDIVMKIYPDQETGGETKPTPGGGGGETGNGEGSGNGSEVASEFVKEGLKATNDYRTRHDAKPLTLNSELSKSAMEWAKYLAESDKFEHAPSDKMTNQGENIAAWCDTKPQTATEVTKRWYGEVCDPEYNFSNNNLSWNAGHFTALVWKGSKELGLGYYDKEKDGKICRTMVARYRPPGNKGGQFLENVQKGKFDASKDCKN